jgi:GWxTD domain-containing protein
MMTLDSRLAAPLAHALGRALAHFLWQGALLAAALWVALFIGAGRTARWRHHAAMACLLAMPLAFGATVAVLLGGRPGTVQPPLAPRMIFNSVIPQGTPAAPVDRLAWLAPLWLAGVILFYSFRLAGWLRVDSLRRRGVCAAPPEWQQRLLALAAAVRVSRPVVLLESCMAGVPQVIGYWRPVILLPLGALAGLSAEQVEAILIHELAHIRRADYLVGLMQGLIEGLFFFHPAVWWISAVMRTEREYACDDVVLALRPNARAYAVALTTLEQNRWPAIRPAAAANGGNLIKRIRRLLGDRAPVPSARASALAGAAVLVAAVAVAVVAWPPARSFAQSQPLSSKTSRTPAKNGRKLTYQEWLDEDAAYIITAAERDTFLALRTDPERKHFIEQFWLRRDPTSGTDQNAFKEEHYRRLAYANEHFASSVPGWKTDRGHIYIAYGPPDEIDDHPEVPQQIWRFRYIPELGNGIEVVFRDPGRKGEFRMVAGPAAHGFYWRVEVGSGNAAEFAAQSLRAKGLPAVAWHRHTDRVSLDQVLVGPYPDEASFAKAKAALEAAGFHPDRAQ